jgi:hypothetical protein
MNVLCTGVILVIVLFLMTTIGKKLNEPFEVRKEEPIGLLTLPLQPVVQAQEVNYGGLNKYIYTTPMASYAQVTNNRKWVTPENGSALFPPINGTSLYKW